MCIYICVYILDRMEEVEEVGVGVVLHCSFTECVVIERAT